MNISSCRKNRVYVNFSQCLLSVIVIKDAIYTDTVFTKPSSRGSHYVKINSSHLNVHSELNNFKTAPQYKDVKRGLYLILSKHNVGSITPC